MGSILERSEEVDELATYGIRAFTTTRAVGSFGMLSSEPVRDVSERWAALRRDLRSGGERLATAAQVHGARVVVHDDEWSGWLRVDDADGHVAIGRGTALAVSIADCVPILMAHPGGAVAALHAGWRGVAGGILEAGIHALAARGVPARELLVHFGPAICGDCYEVGPDVAAQLTGHRPEGKSHVDLRALLADRARAAGVAHITTSPSCTRCDNDRFYSHRAGDEGRQLGVILAER